MRRKVRPRARRARYKSKDVRGELPIIGSPRRSKAERMLVARLGPIAIRELQKKYGGDAVRSMAERLGARLKQIKANEARRFKEFHVKAVKELPALLKIPAARIRKIERSNPKLKLGYHQIEWDKATGRARLLAGGRLLKVVGWKRAHRWLATQRQWERIRRLSAALELPGGILEARRLLAEQRRGAEARARRYIASAEFRSLSPETRDKVRRRMKRVGMRAVQSLLDALDLGQSG